MGTEVLHPQDCLIQRLRSVPTISPRRKPQPPSLGHGNSRSCRRATKRGPQPDTHQKRSDFSDAVPKQGKNSSPNLVMGQVTILKRGESLDSKVGSEFKKNDLKKSASLNEADLIVCGTDRLGPDPELVPKQIRLTDALFTRPGSGTEYAGSGFSQSPSPRSLPLPTFSKKNISATVDDYATKDLRRLLRLD